MSANPACPVACVPSDDLVAACRLVDALAAERDALRAALADVERERDAARAAIAGLFDASDRLLGPGWRADTLNAGEDGDELNAAWDACADIIAPADEVGP